MNRKHQWMLIILTSVLIIAFQVSLLFNGVNPIFVYALGFVLALIIAWFIIKLIFE